MTDYRIVAMDDDVAVLDAERLDIDYQITIEEAERRLNEWEDLSRVRCNAPVALVMAAISGAIIALALVGLAALFLGVI